MLIVAPSGLLVNHMPFSTSALPFAGIGEPLRLPEKSFLFMVHGVGNPMLKEHKPFGLKKITI
jgi:hypothetical protein